MDTHGNMYALLRILLHSQSIDWSVHVRRCQPSRMVQHTNAFELVDSSELNHDGSALQRNMLSMIAAHGTFIQLKSVHKRVTFSYAMHACSAMSETRCRCWVHIRQPMVLLCAAFCASADVHTHHEACSLLTSTVVPMASNNAQPVSAYGRR
jgi:hypothetical protein